MKALHNPEPNNRRGGFTLIEVALATLAMGLGVVVLLSLLPAGLQLAEDDRADTRCGEFAEVVMNGMRGNASSIPSWGAFSGTNFSHLAITNILAGQVVVAGGNSVVTVAEFPPSSGEFVRYTLEVAAGSPPTATLRVCAGRYGAFTPMLVARTGFSYQGD